MFHSNLEGSKIIKKKGITIIDISESRNFNTDLSTVTNNTYDQENDFGNIFKSQQPLIPLAPPENIQDFGKPQEQDNERSIHDRYYKNQKIQIVMPILHQNDRENDNAIQNNQERITQIGGDLEKITNTSEIQNNTDISQTQNNMEVSELQYQLDDAVSDEFKEKVNHFMNLKPENDFENVFGMTKRVTKSNVYIRIVEVQNFNQICEELLQLFPNLRYSEICYVIPLLITKESCIEFLESHRKTFKVISVLEHQSKINQMTQTQKNQKSKIQISEQGKNLFKTTKNEQQNQKQIKAKAKVPFENGLNQINLSQIKLSKEELQNKFLTNRERLIQKYTEKAELIKEFQGAKINEQTFSTMMKNLKEKIQKLISEGKQLFVQQMTFQQNFCVVDFHKFFTAEIENLLDGIFDKVDEYKQKNLIREITMKIIVGKGNHSINGKPVIGPMTQQYIRQEFQKEVQIDKGVIIFIY